MPLTDAFQGQLTEAMVYEAIADVLDPELDEPLVKLGFIDSVQVDEGDVSVTFKLPTFWCAPNFAYLMATDLRRRVCALPGVHTARVVLLDHCTGDEITTGINRGQSFAEVFPDETPEDEALEDLRHTFLRKGFLMRQDALLRQMLKVGLDEAAIAALHLADLHIDESANVAFITVQSHTICLEGVSHNATVYLQRRASLGLPQRPDDPLITDEQGQPLQPGSLTEFLRRSRSVRLSIMFNTSMCKSLFRTRYEGAGSSEAHRDREGENP